MHTCDNLAGHVLGAAQHHACLFVLQDQHVVAARQLAAAHRARDAALLCQHAVHRLLAPRQSLLAGVALTRACSPGCSAHASRNAYHDASATATSSELAKSLSGSRSKRNQHTLTYSSRMFGFSRISLYAVPITTHSCPSGRFRMPSTAEAQCGRHSDGDGGAAAGQQVGLDKGTGRRQPPRRRL